MKNEYKDTYTVKVFRDKETNNVTQETWYDEHGKRHRINAPAFQSFDPKTGKMIEAWYYLHGMLHRDEKDGPAIQCWDAETGNLVYEEYKQYSKGNRSGGKPAVVSYDPKTGEITEARYMDNGVDIDPKTGQPLWDNPAIGDTSDPM